MGKNWIPNEIADGVVARAQSTPNNETIQELMDLISGVSSYKISNQARQGVIRRAFEKECRKARLSGNDYSNFSLSFDDIISVFWETIFAHLPKAKVHGSTVTTRVVKGQQDANISNQHDRQTNCNSINWLRMHGIMGVRNTINKTYSKNLIQICNDCGHKAKSDSREVTTKSCPKCLSTNTVEHWPDNSSKYKSTKERKCNDCNNIWKRKFTYVCAKCLSVDVHIESIFDSKSDLIYEVVSDSTIEDEHMVLEMESEIKNIVDGLYESMPLNPDPNSNQTSTKAREILDIIFKPETSKDICARCALAKNPKYTCGADSFSMDKCINYSKHIGDYQGVSAALSFRRIKIIRNYFVKYIVNNQHNELCASIYTRLRAQGRV